MRREKRENEREKTERSVGWVSWRRWRANTRLPCTVSHKHITCRNVGAQGSCAHLFSVRTVQMQDIECQQLVIPLPKRRRVNAAAAAAAAAAARPPLHTEQLTCASLVSMYLPVPSISVPCARGLYEGMVHRVLARRVADVPAMDTPETLPLADDPCSVVAGMLILASQAAVATEAAPATPKPPSTLAVVLAGDHGQSSATVETREVPLLPPELCRTLGTEMSVDAVLHGLAVPECSVGFDTTFAEQHLTRDLVFTHCTPDTAPPSFVALMLDDASAQCSNVQEMEVPVLQMDGHEWINDSLHPAAVPQALGGDLVPAIAEDSADSCVITPSMTFDQLLCKETQLQISAPVPMNNLLMEQLLCQPSRPCSVETREAPLMMMQCKSTEPCWTRELAHECQPCTGDDNETPPELPLAEQSWSELVVERDLALPWSTVARLRAPELPAALLQSHNLTQMSTITAALVTPEQEQTALRQRIELSLPPFWSSSRMTALKQNLCLCGISTTASTPVPQLVHPTAAEVLLQQEATLVTDRPAAQREDTLAVVHRVPVLPSPGRLSVSPLDNFMRLRGCTPRKVDSQPVPVPASSSTTVPLTLQSCVTPWHVCPHMFFDTPTATHCHTSHLCTD